MWLLIYAPNSTAVEFIKWMHNYIQLIYMEVITYPCLKPDVDLVNSCLV